MTRNQYHLVHNYEKKRQCTHFHKTTKPPKTPNWRQRSAVFTVPFDKKRSVPRVVRLASQVRGKAKAFKTAINSYRQLAETFPNGNFPGMLRDAESSEKDLERALEALVAKLQVLLTRLESPAHIPDTRAKAS